jgi:hypothetical protein
MAGTFPRKEDSTISSITAERPLECSQRICTDETWGPMIPLESPKNAMWNDPRIFRTHTHNLKLVRALLQSRHGPISWSFVHVSTSMVYTYRWNRWSYFAKEYQGLVLCPEKGKPLSILFHAIEDNHERKNKMGLESFIRCSISDWFASDSVFPIRWRF